jgi:PAS domain S-box-containing protein
MPSSHHHPLPQRTRRRIGLLAAQLSDYNGTALLQGVSDAAAERDVDVICFIGGELRPPHGSEGQKNILYALASAESIDGLVFWGGALTYYVGMEGLEAFCRRYLPLPMVSAGPAPQGIPSVCADNYQGMYEAASHLIEVHGCRRPAFLPGPQNHEEAQIRLRGYADALKNHGLSPDSKLVAPPGFWSRASGREGVGILLDDNGVRFDALMAAGDQITLGAMEELQRRGLRVPGDVAVASFDDSTEARYVSPPLTSASLLIYEQGYRALAIVMDMIEGRPATERVTLPARLSVRRSCGCADSTVSRAAIGTKAAEPEKRFGSEPGSALVGLRGKALLDMSRAGMEPAAAEKLYDAFTKGLTGERGDEFVPALDAALDRAAGRGENLAAWQDALSAMRLRLLPHLDDRETAVRAEDLLHQARVAIEERRLRVHSLQQWETENYTRRLQEIVQSLIATLDSSELADVLADELPRLGIPSCCLSLYERPQVYAYPQPAPQRARLIMAYDGEGRAELEKGGRWFPSRQLAPAGMLDRARRSTMVVEPLFFRESQLGFVLFEIGPRNAALFDALADQISGVLKRELLFQEQARAEQELARERNLLRSLIDNIPDFIYVKDAEGRFLMANLALARLIGVVSPKELLGKTDFDFFPRELASKYRTDEREVISSAKPMLEAEERTVDEAGVEKWITTTKVPLKDAAGAVFGLVGMGKDITERKRAEDALRRERYLLGILLDNIPDYIYFKDAESRFLRTNRAHAHAFGLKSPEEAVGKSDFDFFTEEHARQAFEDEQRIMRTGLPIIGEVEKETWPDGRETWASTTKMPLRDLAGNIVGTFGVSRDVTAQKLAEEALRRSEERYHRQNISLRIASEVARAVTSILDIDVVLPRVVELIRERFGFYHVGILLTDDASSSLTLRAARGPLSGFTAEGLSLPAGGQGMIASVGRSGKPHVSQDVSQDPLYLFFTPLNETRAEAAIPLLIGDAVIGVLDVQSERTGAFQPETVSILSTMADQIAVAVQNARLHAAEKARARELERAYKTLEEHQGKLLISEKMASIGRLTAGIAHEMNTPLAAVRASLKEAEKLVSEYQDAVREANLSPADHLEIAREMQRAHQLAASSVERAVLFVRGINAQTRDLAPQDRQRFNAVPVIRETLILIGHALRAGKCEAAFTPSSEVVELLGSPGRLSQVVTNLLTNSIDACKSAGTGAIEILLARRAGSVRLSVSDTGSGIAAEHLPRIFDPMFTTKPFGQGTGLGLTIVHGIVVGEFGATIQAESVPGRGATFTIDFPDPGESP